MSRHKAINNFEPERQLDLKPRKGNQSTQIPLWELFGDAHVD